MKYNNRAKSIIIVATILLYGGCRSVSDICNQDTLYESEHTVGFISNIALENSFFVKLIQDTCDKIILRADECNSETVSFSNKGNWLHISNTLGKDVFYGKKEIPELEIHAKNIDTITANAYCNIVSPDTLRFKYFTMLFYGEIGSCNVFVNNRFVGLSCTTISGKYLLSGKCVWSSISVSGYSETDASACKTGTVMVLSNTDKPIYVNAESAIRAYLLKDGDIVVNSMPNRVELREFSSGRLREKH